MSLPSSSAVPILARRASRGTPRRSSTSGARRLRSVDPAQTRPSDPSKGVQSMDVILLERIAKLGQMGDIVRVSDGFARNFLLPQGKALRATEPTSKRFEFAARAARGAQPRAEAGSRAGRRQARRTVLRLRPPGRRDRPALRLGVGARHRRRDRRRAASRSTATRSPSTSRSRRSACTRSTIALHPEVEAKVTVNVARSEDEAARQAKGEDLTTGESEPVEEESPAESEAPAEEEAAAPAQA